MRKRKPKRQYRRPEPTDDEQVLALLEDMYGLTVSLRHVHVVLTTRNLDNEQAAELLKSAGEMLRLCRECLAEYLRRRPKLVGSWDHRQTLQNIDECEAEFTRLEAMAAG